MQLRNWDVNCLPAFKNKSWSLVSLWLKQRNRVPTIPSKVKMVIFLWRNQIEFIRSPLPHIHTTHTHTLLWEPKNPNTPPPPPACPQAFEFWRLLKNCFPFFYFLLMISEKYMYVPSLLKKYAASLYLQQLFFQHTMYIMV